MAARDVRVSMPVTRRLLTAMVLLGCLAAACGPISPPAPAGTLALVLVAGPTCPVMSVPPDPGCAPRSVTGQVIVIVEGDREVARGTSDANGMMTFSLPFGRYTVHSISDGSLPMAPADQVVDVGPVPTELVLEFDTGIR